MISDQFSCKPILFVTFGSLSDSSVCVDPDDVKRFDLYPSWKNEGREVFLTIFLAKRLANAAWNAKVWKHIKR